MVMHIFKSNTKPDLSPLSDWTNHEVVGKNGCLFQFKLF